MAGWLSDLSINPFLSEARLFSGSSGYSTELTLQSPIIPTQLTIFTYMRMTTMWESPQYVLGVESLWGETDQKEIIALRLTSSAVN